MSTATTEAPVTPANGQKTEIASRPPAPQREIRVVQDSGPLGYLMDTAKFEHMQRLSLLMANASLTPKHLKGQTANETLGNCFRVANQAVRWGFDPFAVMDETYVVNGKLGYQGKLVAAVINARAGLVGRLRYVHSGIGEMRAVEVIGQFENEEEPRTVSINVKQAKTTNKMWVDDPDQKLIYSGVIKWARRHCPEIILGVMTDDDVDRFSERETIHIDPTPALPMGSKSDQLAAVLSHATTESTADVMTPQETSAAEATPETAATDGEISPDLARALSDLPRCETLTQVTEVGNVYAGHGSPLSAAEIDQFKAACEERREAIKATRGGMKKAVF